MQEETQKQSFLKSIYELLFLTKVCLTSFWFWVPSLFALFVVLQLYMMCINPLLLLVGPGVLVVAAFIWEDRRTKAQYGLKEIKLVKSTDMMFTAPRKVEQSVDVDRLVKEYSKMLDKNKKRQSTENTGKQTENE